MNDLAGVRRELVTLYRAARRSEIDPADATRLASILAQIARAIEGSEIEERLRELEDRQA